MWCFPCRTEESRVTFYGRIRVAWEIGGTAEAAKQTLKGEGNCGRCEPFVRCSAKHVGIIGMASGILNGNDDDFWEPVRIYSPLSREILRSTFFLSQHSQFYVRTRNFPREETRSLAARTSPVWFLREISCLPLKSSGRIRVVCRRDTAMSKKRNEYVLCSRVLGTSDPAIRVALHPRARRLAFRCARVTLYERPGAHENVPGWLRSGSPAWD